MSNPARELESKALKLSRRKRARLAQRLISSLDGKADPGAERLWLEEAERRLAELKSGKVSGISAEKVIRKARSGSTSSSRFSARMSDCSCLRPPASC